MSIRALAFATAILLSACRMPGTTSTPVIDAARSGDTVRLRQLLDSGADPNEPAGVNGWTPLLDAIHKNQPGSVSVLIAHGAGVNRPGAGGVTPLVMAAGYGYADIVRTLLKAGADPRLRTSHGEDALAAAVGGTSDIDRFTVGHCQTETVRALLDAAPDLRLPAGSSAMRIAKFGGCADLVRMLNR